MRGKTSSQILIGGILRLIKAVSSKRQFIVFSLDKLLLLMKVVQYIYNSMDNQFINAPLLVNQSTKTDSKDQLIKRLQLKNSKLKTELIKIQKAIEQKFSQHQQSEPQKKRESIFQSEQSYEVLTKELANTYKKIKMYEYEVGKLQDGNRSVNMSQKSSQYQMIIKQKRSMGEKLKQQLAKEKKVVDENVRRLERHSQKNDMQIYLKKLSDQIKFYRQKIKYMEEKQALKAGNMKKQYEAIKKTENQLLQAGVAAGEIEDLKRNAIKNITTSAPKKEMNQTKQELQVEGSDEQIEDRTRQNYQSLLGEVALLEKMQHDYEKQMLQASEDKMDAINKNMNSRNRLLECENEIQNLQRDIEVMKGRVVPSNMKPLRPIRSLSSHQSQNPQKLMPAKSIGSSMLKNKGLNHLLRYDEVGFPSNKGQRFTDRLLLGKNNLTAKITAIKIYIDYSTNLISGLQCTYSGNKKGGEHVRKDKDQRQKQYKEQQFVCRGSSFFRSIAGSLNAEDKLQFLNMTSSDGTSYRSGTVSPSGKSFTLQISPQEYPTCLFGSLLVIKEAGKKEYSVIEHLGFQIQGDSINSHSLLVNEFNQ